MSNLLNDFKVISSAFGESPTITIRQLEYEIPKAHRTRETLTGYLKEARISTATLASALNLKTNLGQLHVLIHSLGILLSLPYILKDNENIQSISLGAGNTGKDYDLTTDYRVAEFKFIHWRGGAESIRQNNVFKAFLHLLWDTSGKKRQLFLTGTEEAVNFLQGGRALSSVLSKDHTTRTRFEAKYENQYQTVGQFYKEYQPEVEIMDLRKLVPAFEINEILEEQ